MRWSCDGSCSFDSLRSFATGNLRILLLRLNSVLKGERCFTISIRAHSCFKQIVWEIDWKKFPGVAAKNHWQFDSACVLVSQCTAIAVEIIKLQWLWKRGRYVLLICFTCLRFATMKACQSRGKQIPYEPAFRIIDSVFQIWILLSEQWIVTHQSYLRSAHVDLMTCQSTIIGNSLSWHVGKC